MPFIIAMKQKNYTIFTMLPFSHQQKQHTCRQLKMNICESVRALFMRVLNGTYEGAKWHITDTELAIIQWHLRQCRQGMQSTRPKPSKHEHLQCQLAYITTYTPGQIFTNQMGHFPIQPNRRHKYIVIILLPIAMQFSPNQFKIEPCKNCCGHVNSSTPP